MKQIELTQGKKAQVDDEDYEYLKQWKWYAHKCKNTFYAQRGFRKENGKLGNIQMHRVIMNLKKYEIVDHIDRDGLNNQKSNLRMCNNSQNQMNKTGWGKSKYKGVNLQRGKYFAAHIRINGIQKHIGSFKTDIEAARAYDKEAIKVFGDFAKLNFN